MDRSTFMALTQDIYSKCGNLLIGKGDDYAGEDVLANFKRMNQLCSLLGIDTSRSSGDCGRFLMLLKVDRWCNLINKGTEPKNESLLDTVLDLHNYIDLAYACDKEGR